MNSSHPLYLLFKSIEKHLENNEESLNRFSQLETEFKEDKKDKKCIYNQIQQLINNDEYLLSALSQAKIFFDMDSESPIDLIRDFTIDFTKSLSSSLDLIPVFTRMTSLFVEGFVTFHFFQYFLNKIYPENHFGDHFQHLKNCLDDKEQHLRNKSLPNLKISEGFLSPTLKPSFAAQYLATIPILIDDEEKQKSVLKCLKLFGLQLISHQSALNWLESIHEYFCLSFQNLIESTQLNSSLIIPSKIFADLMSNTTETQLIWAFGANFYSILKSMPKVNANNAVQLNNEIFLEKHRLNNQHSRVSEAAVHIVDVQSIKLFATLKATSISLRSGKQLNINSIPEGVIDALFGKNCNLDKTNSFYRTLIRKCYEIGADSTSKYINLLKTRFELFNPSTVDGRTAYNQLIRPSTVLRNIVFNGAKFDLLRKDILEQTIIIARETISHFTGLSEKFERFIEAFLAKLNSNDKFGLDDSAVLSVFYFLELGNLISDVDPSMTESIKLIPDMIFRDKPPFKEFDLRAISNVDIVLKNFAKSLNKTDDKQFFDNQTPILNKDFVFQLNAGQNIFVSKGIINPIIGQK